MTKTPSGTRPCQGPTWRRAALRVPALLLVFGLGTGVVVGCGGSLGDTVPIERTRLASKPFRPPLAGAPLRERISSRNTAPSASTAGGSAASPSPSPGLVYDLPAGWRALAPTQFRQINLQFVEDPSAELVLSFLQSDGGGLLANVNRWRGQLGLGPASAADVAALPKRTVFRQEATFVEVFGRYQGMSGPAIEDGGLLGAIFSRGGGTLFIKMTGPREVVEAERESFEAFLDSLDVGQPASAGSDAAGNGAAGNSAAGARPSPLAWDAPEGWSEEPGNGFREVTFRRGNVQMYVSIASGGALININRWAGQLGMEALDDEGLAALPRAAMLDGEAYVFEGVGALQGMTDPAPVPGQRMLAALIERNGQIVTIKTTGPDAEVDAARADFLALVAGLRRSDR